MHLPSVQDLWLREGFKVLVISEDVYWQSGVLEPVSPVL